ncbi:hypothetical protein [Arthrobacter sp. UYCu723]
MSTSTNSPPRGISPAGSRTLQRLGKSKDSPPSDVVKVFQSDAGGVVGVALPDGGVLPEVEVVAGGSAVETGGGPGGEQQDSSKAPQNVAAMVTPGLLASIRAPRFSPAFRRAATSPPAGGT